MSEPSFVNKIERSGIITVDLLDYAPREESVFFDIKEHLFMGMIIKESEFRTSLDAVDWNLYRGQMVAIGCTVDAIIPPWVYMVIADRLQGIALHVDHVSTAFLDLQRWKNNLANANFDLFQDEKVVVRANTHIDPSLYVLATTRLKPLVKTLMYGEAGMPKVIYKKPKQT